MRNVMIRTFLLLVAVCGLAIGQHSAVPVAGNDVSDKEIRLAIIEELWIDDAIDANEIDVETERGIVTMTGSVANILAKDRAAVIAESTVGVRAIVNLIEVEPSVKRSDSELEAAISDALYFDPATDSYEIDVEASRGTVTLKGRVDSWSEKQLCETVTKGVKGVREVRNEILIGATMEPRPDVEIEREVEALLANDVRVDDLLIEVDVADGKVSLSGSVGSLAEKNQAINNSWILGVSSVDGDGLRVESWMRDDMRRKSAFVSRTDKQVENAVKDAMLYDPRVVSFNPDVEVDDGTVILTGTVDNLKARNAAGQDARNTLGVLRVKNYLKVRPETDFSDREIENNVRDALARNVYVDLYDVTVDSVAGKVYLSGKVNTPFERHVAGRVTAGVKGVVAVHNNLDHEQRWVWKPDWEIRENVLDQLFWSAYVSPEQIDVSVENGIVTLTGNVETWSERSAAETNAWEGGARDVLNELTVSHRAYGPYYPYWHDLYGPTLPPY